MSKEKVALLQKTFSLRARASIDDCPIKNGSCTVFENHFKKSRFYLKIQVRPFDVILKHCDRKTFLMFFFRILFNPSLIDPKASLLR